jgi:predicted DNA-binding transcriptional regulator YafY
VFKGGSWYLVGRKRGGDYRTYRVARIEDIDVSDEVFERDPNFDIRSYWTEATDNYNRYANKYPATLRLTEEGFGFVQRMIPGRYTLIPDEKGICLQATFGSLNEARGMVLSMAGMAEVLEPDELRQVIREDAQRVLDLYDK